ncbi:carboxypeptidase regulatory-like domain-containing protein [bacterium]|nr:carboxypeptidase regulatory-like domain-containing protein [bacterium]
MKVLMRCTVAVLAVFLLAAATGCNKLKEIPGNIAGIVMSPEGVGLGYITVQLIDPATTQVMYQMTTEESGNFFFEKCEPLTYTVVIMGMGEVVMDADVKEIKLTPGKTLDIKIIATPPAKES